MFIVVLVTWLGVGVLVGFAASKAVNLRGDDPRFGVGAAVLGAVVGGIMYCMISGAGVGTWTFGGLITATVTAVVVVTAWHLVRSRSISHERYTPRRSY